ncbi:MAG: hypothetical protein OXF47_11755 [Nitrospira sp.]|nr:hypothetical protein [Nitrospira sp.]
MSETIYFKEGLIYHRGEWFGVQLEEPAENEKEELKVMVLEILKQWRQNLLRAMPARDLYCHELLANGVWTISHINWALMELERGRLVCCELGKRNGLTVVESIIRVPEFRQSPDT